MSTLSQTSTVSTEISMSDSLKAARWAVIAAFFLNGMMIAHWVARIPEIARRLDLSERGLGLVLMGMAAGVLASLLFAGGLISQYGSRRMVIIGAIGQAAFLPVLALAPHPILLWMGLFVFGAVTTIMDVSMNSQAVDVEKAYGTPLMSSFHAAFSLGGFFGALLGAVAASIPLTPLVHFMIAMLMGFGMIALFNNYLLPTQSAKDGNRFVFRLPSWSLLPLGIIAFCSSIGEGAMADWSGIYLVKIAKTEEGVAALGYAAFSMAMVVGRLSGDYLTKRFGPIILVRSGGMLATLGILVAVAFPHLVIVLIGFTAVGAGVSVIVPLVFSAAGNKPNLPAGQGIASVASVGYAGFLAGPPVIGLLASVITLRGGLLVVALLAAVMVINAHALRPEAD